jgi:hypothetical protein
LKGVGKIFSKIFLTGVWGGAPRKQKTEIKELLFGAEEHKTPLKINKRHKLTSFELGLKRDVNLLLFSRKNYLN